MVFALLLLLSPLPQATTQDATASTAFAPAAAVLPASEEISTPRSDRAEAAKPAVKLVTKAAPAESKDISYVPGQLVLEPIVRAGEEWPLAEGLDPRRSDMPALPAVPAFRRNLESPAKRRMWYALAFAGHGAAAFDAWSTRRAISNGYGSETNPLLRPFANSNALYVAIQASPALMDYLGRRMMTSRRQWVRRMWWLPQSAGTGVSLASGVHNARLVP